MVRADGGSWGLGGPVSPSGWGADGAGRARCSGPDSRPEDATCEPGTRSQIPFAPGTQP